jgi:hypothetical protein
MPLAIELAAAQVFSMDEIVGSLQAEDNGTSAWDNVDHLCR